VNIVVTTDESWSAPDVTVSHSLDELFEELKKYDSDSVYVIGGANVYEQLLPYCDSAYVTKVDTAKPADKFFPNLDKLGNWVMSDEGEELEHNGVNFRITEYKRI
jgi:dihydrofolate reductase